MLKENRIPLCYQLIGIPGSGKSTWIQNQNWAINCAKVSTDKWVEIYAEEVGKTYSDIFDDFMPTAVKLMTMEVKEFQNMRRDIIWDQTSTTIVSRAKKFNMLPDYDHIAVVFETPPLNELSRRLSNRPGKNIPDNVIKQMIENFEMPSKNEGFKDIIYINYENKQNDA